MTTQRISLAPLARCMVRRHPRASLLRDGAVLVPTERLMFRIDQRLLVDDMMTDFTLTVSSCTPDAEPLGEVWGAQATQAWMTGFDPGINWGVMAEQVDDGIATYTAKLEKAGALR